MRKLYGTRRLCPMRDLFNGLNCQLAKLEATISQAIALGEAYS